MLCYYSNWNFLYLRNVAVIIAEVTTAFLLQFWSFERRTRLWLTMTLKGALILGFTGLLGGSLCPLSPT